MEATERLNELILHYEKDLLRFCCVYLQDAALAQDAVQETFLKAYRSLNRFRGDCSEKAWLLRIAVNTCKDVRRSAWHRHIDRRVTPENLPLPSAPPDDDHLALTDALMRLPPKELEAVLLHHYHGLTQAETARALRITQPAVALRLKKAYTLLRRSLEGDEQHEATP